MRYTANDKNITMNTEVEIEFNRYIAYISDLEGVEKIYLFGSYASGEASGSSDIDLFVLLRDGVDARKTMFNIDRGLRKRSVALDIVADNVSSFERLSASDRNTLQREVKTTGVLVYDK